MASRFYFLFILFSIFFLKTPLSQGVDCSAVLNKSNLVEPKPVVVAVIKRGDRYLFVRRSPLKADGGIWAPVTGGVEPGEAIEQAMIREVKEEVGMKVVFLRRLMDHVALSGKHHLFWIEIEVSKDEEPQNLSPEENAELKWLSIEEIESLELKKQTHPQVTYLLRKAISVL